MYSVSDTLVRQVKQALCQEAMRLGWVVFWRMHGSRPLPLEFVQMLQRWDKRGPASRGGWSVVCVLLCGPKAFVEEDGRHVRTALSYPLLKIWLQAAHCHRTHLWEQDRGVANTNHRPTSTEAFRTGKAFFLRCFHYHRGHSHSWHSHANRGLHRLDDA